jgi:hypothetical protein
VTKPAPGRSSIPRIVGTVKRTMPDSILLEGETTALRWSRFAPQPRYRPSTGERVRLRLDRQGQVRSASPEQQQPASSQVKRGPNATVPNESEARSLPAEPREPAGPPTCESTKQPGPAPTTVAREWPEWREANRVAWQHMLGIDRDVYHVKGWLSLTGIVAAVAMFLAVQSCQRADRLEASVTILCRGHGMTSDCLQQAPPGPRLPLP